MLAELWAYATTSCPPLARRLGYLHEAAAIAGRHARCRNAWHSHLQHSRQAILAAAARCNPRRYALILGSGHLLDIPLAELAAAFREVLLVDLVHPRPARRLARRYPNVRWIEHDLSECLDALLALGKNADGLAIAALGQRTPARFLDQPGIDLVVSANLLSQLPLLPARWLLQRYPQHSEALANQLAWDWMQRHLDYLDRFDARVCLLADLEQTSQGRQGLLQHTDFSGLAYPPAESLDQWDWHIAPLNEAGPGISSRHRVRALSWQGNRSGPQLSPGILPSV